MRNHQSRWVRRSTPLVDLLSDPTPSVHSCVNSARESSGPTSTFTSTGKDVCCAAAASSVSQISTSNINTNKGWAHNPVEDVTVVMTEKE